MRHFIFAFVIFAITTTLPLGIVLASCLGH
jgi:hypothetical protein